jgi:hypothetical protein
MPRVVYVKVCAFAYNGVVLSLMGMPLLVPQINKVLADRKAKRKGGLKGMAKVMATIDSFVLRVSPSSSWVQHSDHIEREFREKNKKLACAGDGGLKNYKPTTLATGNFFLQCL